MPGSWWAHHELGQDGWWFRDPIENASFMPWAFSDRGSLAGRAQTSAHPSSFQRRTFPLSDCNCYGLQFLVLNQPFLAELYKALREKSKGDLLFLLRSPSESHRRPVALLSEEPLAAFSSRLRSESSFFGKEGEVHLDSYNGQGAWRPCSLRQSLGGSRFWSMLGEEIRRQLKELLESLTKTRVRHLTMKEQTEVERKGR
ncbi:hypothetical protein VNO78_07311 [Psophocarpus tetragonolobus]|uniref:Uncharacterized protein n=1 Tax=Psophocarpus tetragonolobus TaxID=3891 RepID=A0AAN9SVZ8_PSOTE